MPCLNLTYDVYNSSILHIYKRYNIPQFCSDRAAFHPCGEASCVLQRPSPELHRCFEMEIQHPDQTTVP